MIDLHLHLLPAVDDGPADEAASLVHAHKLARDGVREATVTPHVGHPDLPVDVHAIAERTRALQQAIDAAGIDLRLALADGALLQVNACSLLGRNGSEAHGIPAEPGHRRAWRSLHEHRMRAAIVAARELGPPGR